MPDPNPTLTAFTAGDLVISIYGDGAGTGSYTLDQAAPIVLEELTATGTIMTPGTIVGDMVLPQTASIVNGVTQYAISGEYGSASEGSLQLSGDGQSLVIMGYGVNWQSFDASNDTSVYGTNAEGQTTSVPGGVYTAVPRIIADIGFNGTVNTSTALYDVYNSNNPRSVATINGTTFYISGQGQTGDTTQGVFVADEGASGATAIDTTTDTRTAVIYNGELYVSRDSTQGVGGTISNYGSVLPTGTTTATILGGIDGSITLMAGQANGVNTGSVGQSINLSPENFFFASPDVMYVADSGVPKEGGIGDGGLQKWIYNGSTWVLAYTLSAGLNLVANTSSLGTTGLIGLTGTVVGGVVELYTTNYTVTELGQSYLFGITDTLAATSLPTNESFSLLETAAPDTIIRGIAFAPSASTSAPTSGTIPNGTTQTADQVTSGSFLDILNGGTAVSATIFTGGTVVVEAGGVDTGSYVQQGGTETVLGTATGDTVAGLQIGTAVTTVIINESILNGGTVELFTSGAMATGVTIGSGGMLAISGASTANGLVISGGTVMLDTQNAGVNGVLTFAGAGAVDILANPGTTYGDVALTSGFVTGDVIDFASTTSIGAAGSAATLSTTTSGGNTVATISGGGFTETIAFAGTTIGSILRLGSDGNGGEEITALPLSGAVTSGTTSSGYVVTSGFFLDVLSGGTVVNTTIQAGGTLAIETGGFDSGATIAAGGNETVLGSATLDKVSGTQLVSAATAVISNETIYNGGTVDLFLAGVLANNTTVLSGGAIDINGHAVANNTTITNGVVQLQSPKATVSGSFDFAGAGTLQFTVATDAGYGDLAVISGFGSGDVVDELAIGSGATLTATTSGIETLATITSGGVTEVLLFAGPAPSNLSLVSDGNGGEEIIYSAGTTSVTTVSAGTSQSNLQITSGSTVNVLSGGTIIGATFFSGGIGMVSSGGVDSGSTIIGGGKETVLGTATGDTVGGVQLVSAATAIVNSETILNGGTVQLFKAGVIASGTTVESGGTLALNGGVFANNTVLDGGLIQLESPKSELSGSLIISGGTIQVTANVSAANGDLAVISGFAGGDVIDLTSTTSIGAAGSSATLTTSTSGGNTIATVSGGGSSETFLFAGTTIASTLILKSDGSGGEELIVSTASPTSTTVPNGITSGGVVTSGSFVDVLSGGTLASASIQSGGSVQVEAGGLDSGSVLSGGGNELVFGSATLDQIYGTQLISAATAIITNETIYNGGAADLFLKGAVATGIVVSSGGAFNISGNATAFATVLNGGGLLELQSPKATLGGTVTFAGSGGTIEVIGVGSAGFGDLAVISNFGTGDVIDESGIAPGATLIASTSGGNTIETISGGGSTQSFILAGTNIASGLTLVADGRGGVDLQFGSSSSSSGSSGPTVSSGSTVSNFIVNGGTTLTVLNGGTIVNATVMATGTILVQSGGVDSGSIISSGGTETVTGSAMGDQIGGTQFAGGTVSGETILNGGSVTVQATGIDSGSTILTSGFELVLGSANLDQISGIQLVSAATAVVSNETVFNGGSVDLFLAGAIANNLTISSGGYLNINGHAVASNTVLNGGTLELQSAKAVLSGSLTFSGAGDLEVTGNTSSGYGDLAVISGFGAGDVIDLTSATSVGAAGSAATLSTTTSGGDTYATVSGGGSVQTFIFAGTTIAGSLTLGTDGAGGEQLTEVACFLPGTLILTDRGEVPVERLRTGDTVVTVSGAERRLCWIGHGKALATRGRRTAATPLIVRKGALGDNVPHQDLRITKGHSLYFDGVLIPVEFLVNHRSILWDDHAREVTVYHLELDTHDVLLANGAPAESYRDDGNRWLFQNANTGWDQPAKAPCVPVLTGGPVVDAVWRRLLERAGAVVRVPLTEDPDLHLTVDGARIEAAQKDDGVHVFRVPASAGSVRIGSRAVVPQELGLARDPRCLGVALRHVAVRQGTRFRTVLANDPQLESGFHLFEEGNGFVWTDGDAALPMDLLSGFSGVVEVVLMVASTTRYVDEGLRTRVA